MGDESKTYSHIHRIDNRFALELTEPDTGVDDAEE